MAILGSATYKLDSDNSKLNRGLAKAEKTSKERGRRIGANLAKIGAATLAMGAVAGVGLFKLGRQASDLGESVNAVKVVFGEGAQAVLDFSRTTKTAVGLASADFNQLSATTGALFTLYGLSEKEAAKETINLTNRAADLASVFNVDVKDALFALQAGIRGETEPLRRFAGDVTDASLELYLMNKGIDQSVKDMTQAEKGLLRYEVAMEQTSKVAGDFKNTSTSAANATRVLKAQIKDLAAHMGKGLLPVFEKGIKWVQSFVTELSDGGLWQRAWDNIKTVARTAWTGIKKVYDNVLAPIGRAAAKLWDKINWKAVWTGIMTAVGLAWTGIKKVYDNVLAPIGRAGSKALG